MRTQNNYFTMPNEVFQLGLSAGELAVYSYLRRCEDRRTHQCWPSYRKKRLFAAANIFSLPRHKKSR